MAFSLTKRFAILCEGPADQIFFEKLLDQRKIKDFDIPPHVELGKSHGVAGLGKMLRSLAGDPLGYAKLKGVIIIADSSTSTTATFRSICKKLTEDGPFTPPDRFAKPAGPNQITKQPAGHPYLSIMLIPLGGAGALETVCAEAIVQQRPWLADCVSAYLSCGEIKALNWSAEKRDKARLQCMIAALYERDPNKGLRYLLGVRPPMISFKSTTLTPIVRQITKFRDKVNTL